MTQKIISQSLNELKVSGQELADIAAQPASIASELATDPLVRIKKLIQRPNYQCSLDCAFSGTLNGSPFNRTLTLTSDLDLSRLLSWPKTEQPAAASSPQTPVTEADQPNPLTIIGEATLPHGYGLVQRTKPELAQAVSYVETYLDHGLIRFDCAHLFSAVLAPHFIVNQNLCVKNFCAPLEVVRSTKEFKQEYFWQDPDNDNLSHTVKLVLSKL